MQHTDMQRLFDTAVEGVLKQGQQSYDTENNHCCYRDPFGNACAVGHLIADEYITPDFPQSITVKHQLVIDAVEKSQGIKLTPLAVDMLLALQEAHDSTNDCAFRDNFMLRAKQVARDFNLEWRF